MQINHAYCLNSYELQNPPGITELNSRKKVFSHSDLMQISSGEYMKGKNKIF